MNKHRFIRNTLSVVALGALLVAAAAAQTGALPAVQQSGSVRYMSGGIGSDESQAMQAEGRQWPLTLEFTVNTQPRADYAANVQVTVHDAKNQVALQAKANGPFMLVKLAPGHYTVDALYGGKTLHQSVTIVAGQPAKSMFTWPAGTTAS